jgi:hypothetical protein
MRNSEWCVNHDPEQAETRRRRASKGGKRGDRGRPQAELAALRVENADIRKRLLEGELSPWTDYEVVWSYDGEGEDEGPGETAYCEVCRRPVHIVLTWADI